MQSMGFVSWSIVVVAAVTPATARADPAAVHAASTPTRTPTKQRPTVRDAVASGALGAGALAVIVSIGETAHAVSLGSRANEERSGVPATVIDVCATQNSQNAVAACEDSKRAQSAWTTAWVAYGAGRALAATGIVLLVTRPHAETSGGVDVAPALEPRGAGLRVRLVF